MSTPPRFAHLHVHTHYSLLDGANRIPDLISRVKQLDMPAVAITDHGNMFGVVEFFGAAKKAGVKPILGMEAYIAPGDRRSRDAAGMSEASFHLLLLAENLIGFRNLMKLSSIAYREGFYYRPRIDREALEAHREGLICTSTCLAAEIPQALMRHDRGRADEIADWYLRVFGPERFYIELQDHGIQAQREINPELIDLARRRGIGVIATNDVHYLTRGDADAHDVLLCISTGRLVSDEDRMKFEGDQFYLKSPEEMAAVFAAQPEALDNTLRIVERCNVELELGRRYTPVYHPPEQKSPEPYLRELVYEGAHRKYGAAGGLSTEVRERIDYELEVIASKGFSSYFLIVWDFVRYARSHGIPCGARGSGCSAVVAYCLDLSQPDPLRYGLYFERFMDPDRDEMPDIDIDICQEGREDVIRYVREKYGHVAQIITFGTLKARAAIRDVCRVLGVPLAEADRVAKLVPEQLKMTIDKAIEQEPELKALYKENETIRRVLDVSRRIEGLARHAGVHAAGVVIAEQPLENYVPVYRQSETRTRATRGDNGSNGGNGAAADITQFDGVTVEKIGLLKMDFLGLRTLTILERARRLAASVAMAGGRARADTASPGPVEHPLDAEGLIDLESIDLTDQRVYGLFARGETQGVFQFESGGMRDVLMKMRPNRIEDLIAANALYRPGPMVNIDAYVARKHGEPWKTPHAIMDDVLAETYGIIVYQEQVARLVNRLGGIERKRAFRLAKAISKKKTHMIEAERAPFVEGAVRNGVDKKTAEDIFNQILPFGEYAFNKAHSTGYALIAYQTAYMKAYFPHEFMAAVLTFESQAQKPEQWNTYIDECRRMGIEVRPPDVNSSDADFTVVPIEAAAARDHGAKQRGASAHRRTEAAAASGACLRFGLRAIKGVGDGAVEAILAARRSGGPFRDLYDFCERVDLQTVNRSTIEALIKSGAFDTTGAMRRGLMHVLDAAMQAGAGAQADRRAGQLSMFDSFGAADSGPPRTIPTDEWTEAEMLAHEKAVLGFYVTAHPLTRHVATLNKYASADAVDLSVLDDGVEVVLGGMISRVRYVVTKSGRNAGSKLAVAMFEDLTGGIEAVIFSEELEKYRGLVAPEKLVFLRGRVDRKREEPSLRVSEVVPLEEAPQRLAAAVILHVSAATLTPERLRRLHELCRAFRGDRPLFLEIRSSRGLVGTVRAGSGLSIAPGDEFVRAAGAELGERNVSIVGPMRRIARPAPAAPPEYDTVAEEPVYEEAVELAPA
ncbi:MAG: DNA polymerase III subunit alpha [Phycisphaerae bacterium]|nr:DNA polymerase III subunit alpha [Phycisphaerae bacterium]NUQ45272.1 DNA polymerase III subunit alpha [Phycisphaerae bacterium]